MINDAVATIAACYTFARYLIEVRTASNFSHILYSEFPQLNTMVNYCTTYTRAILTSVYQMLIWLVASMLASCPKVVSSLAEFLAVQESSHGCLLGLACGLT